VESQLFTALWNRYHQWLPDIELIQIRLFPASYAKINPRFTAGMRSGVVTCQSTRGHRKTTTVASIVYDSAYEWKHNAYFSSFHHPVIFTTVFWLNWHSRFQVFNVQLVAAHDTLVVVQKNRSLQGRYRVAQKNTVWMDGTNSKKMPLSSVSLHQKATRTKNGVRKLSHKSPLILRHREDKKEEKETTTSEKIKETTRLKMLHNHR
jgi:hypothetical protein